MNRLFIHKNIMMMSTIVLAATSNLLFAGSYFKIYAGNTNASSRYETVRFGLDPSDPATTYSLIDYKKVNTANLVTPGAAIGFNTPVNLVVGGPNLTFGLELSAQRQLEGYSFDSDPDTGETAVSPADSEQLKININNRFKSTLSAVLGISDVFYLKFGPTLVRQKLTSTLFVTNQPRSVANFEQSDTRDIYGLNLGSGLSYKLTKNISVFSEYNYSHYFKQNIKDFSYQSHLLSDNGAGLVTTYTLNDTRVKFSQGEFFVGFQVSA